MDSASHDRIAWLDQGPGHQLFRVEGGLAYRFLPTTDEPTRQEHAELLTRLCEAMAQATDAFPDRRPSPDAPSDPLTLEITEPVGHRLSALGPRVSSDLACRVGGALLQGLAPLHDAGLFHGALTPRRLLWRPGDGVWIMDTGIGLFGATPGPLRVNTPAFVDLYHASGLVPPELLTGGQLSPASDVYLVAGLVAQWLTGRPLYQRPTGLDTYRAIARGGRAPLAQMDLGLPDALKGALDRALAARPDARPAGSELREALAGHRAAEASTEPSWGAPPSPWWPQERPGRAPEDAPAAPGSEREQARLRRLQQATLVLQGARRSTPTMAPSQGRALALLLLAALVVGALVLSRWAPSTPHPAPAEDQIQEEGLQDDETTAPSGELPTTR